MVTLVAITAVGSRRWTGIAVCRSVDDLTGGTLMGLAISAAVPSSDWATLCMIGLVIPENPFLRRAGSGARHLGAHLRIIDRLLLGQHALLGQLDELTRRLIDDTMLRAKRSFRCFWLQFTRR